MGLAWIRIICAEERADLGLASQFACCERPVPPSDSIAEGPNRSPPSPLRKAEGELRGRFVVRKLGKRFQSFPSLLPAPLQLARLRYRRRRSFHKNSRVGLKTDCARNLLPRDSEGRGGKGFWPDMEIGTSDRRQLAGKCPCLGSAASVFKRGAGPTRGFRILATDGNRFRIWSA